MINPTTHTGLRSISCSDFLNKFHIILAYNTNKVQKTNCIQSLCAANLDYKILTIKNNNFKK